MLAGQQGERAVILEFMRMEVGFAAFTSCPRSQDRSNDAVLLCLGNSTAHDAADKVFVAFDIHGLHIGAASGHLARPAAGAFDKNIHARAQRRPVERILLCVQQLLQRLQPVRLDVSGTCRSSLAASVPGRGLYLKE